MDLTARAEALVRAIWNEEADYGCCSTSPDVLALIEDALREVVEERDKVWRDAWREMRGKELL